MKRVGFVGMGIMGSRMAATLARKGFVVSVWSRDLTKCEPLKQLNISVATSLTALAQSVEVLCTCVADPSALKAVLDGPQGLFAGSKRGQLLIDFSTIDPETAKNVDVLCAERGIDFVECPVTGSRNGAEKGTLLLMVGSTQENFAKAKLIFDAVGERAIHCGPVGSASQIKLGGNVVIAAMLQAITEGLMVTSKAGISPQKLLEVVQASGFRSPYFDFKGPALLKHDFETHFSIDLMFKDLGLFLGSAAEHRIPTPLAASLRETYNTARAHGLGNKDIGAVLESLEQMSQHKLS